MGGVMGFFIFALWVVLCIAVGVWASRKGRSGIGFFFLALVFSPLIIGLVVFALSLDKEAIERAQLREGMRKCPKCAELIKQEAVKCRYCGTELEPAGVVAPELGAMPPTGWIKMTPEEVAARKALDLKIWIGVAVAIVALFVAAYFRT